MDEKSKDQKNLEIFIDNPALAVFKGNVHV